MKFDLEMTVSGVEASEEGDGIKLCVEDADLGEILDHLTLDTIQEYINSRKAAAPEYEPLKEEIGLGKTVGDIPYPEIHKVVQGMTWDANAGGYDMTTEAHDITQDFLRKGNFTL